MNIIDLFGLGFKNIKTNKVRSFIAIFIIALGVFLLLIFSALQNLVLSVKEVNTNTKFDLRQIKIDGSRIENTSNGKSPEENSSIVLKDIEEISKHKAIEGIYPVHRIDYINNNKTFDALKLGKIYMNPNIILMGLRNDFDYFDIGKVEKEKIANPSFNPIVAGRIFDRQSKTFEVILPEIALLSLKDNSGDVFINAKARNEALKREFTILINGKKVSAKVVGVYSYKIMHDGSSIDESIIDVLKGNSSMSSNYGQTLYPIYVNEPLTKEIVKRNMTSFKEEDYIPKEIIITLSDVSEVEKVSKYIQDNYKYYVSSKIGEAKQMMLSFTFFKKVLGVIGGIILFIALLNTVNTMFMVLRERIRYIGTLKSIGYNNTNILFILSVESILLGMIGGFTGIILAYSGEFLISSLIKKVLQYSDMYKYVIFGTSPIFALLSLVGCILLALICGLIPAIIGSRLDTLDALHH